MEASSGGGESAEQKLTEAATSAAHAESFVFERYAFDAATASLALHYRFQNGPSFIERIVFPPITRALAANDRAALDQAFRLIFLLAGISYYKAYAPPQLVCEAFPLDTTTAHFIEETYRQGLGEFAYKNNLDLRDRIHVVADAAAPAPKPVRLALSHHLCIPVGGGKDSIVTLESLKSADAPITLFALVSAAGIARPIADTIHRSSLPAVQVQRFLSESIFDLNARGAYNGHVPVTAILSAIAIATALMQGFDTVVMSNEHSASAPNFEFNNTPVNHQYSKSLAFENALAAYVRTHISPDFSYFSFLRPLSESAIMQRFAQLEKYHDVFLSCNKAFRQDTTKRGTGWCCACPKCRFVFLAFAPFTKRAHLVQLFGQDMLADSAQEEGFAELCGLSAYKPFECVGEVEESALLMQKLARMPEWASAATVQKLAPQLDGTNFDERYAALFALQADHNVPTPYLKQLHADC